jgi:hypothetical protein
MGELEQLARDLGNIPYLTEQGIELLMYRDLQSQVTAAQYPDGEKSLSYYVNAEQLDFYRSQLQTLTSEISKQISEMLAGRVPCTDVPDVAQQLLGGSFPLADFSEISDIIRLHQRLA